jgi:hypothetical protein
MIDTGDAIPIAWIKEHLEFLLSVAKLNEAPDSARDDAVSRVRHILDMVDSWREAERRR